MEAVRLGFAPTRRSIFSAPAAVEYAGLTREKLKKWEWTLWISMISRRTVCSMTTMTDLGAQG